MSYRIVFLPPTDKLDPAEFPLQRLLQETRPTPLDLRRIPGENQAKASDCSVTWVNAKAQTLDNPVAAAEAAAVDRAQAIRGSFGTYDGEPAARSAASTFPD